MIELVNVYQAGRIIEGAVEFLYKVLAERPPEANISHGALPTLEQHRAFVTRRPYRAWYLVAAALQAPREGLASEPIAFEPVWVGTISVTNHNEIGVAILKDYRRRGFAREAVLKLMSLVAPLEPVPSERPEGFVANVSPENHASHALFEGLGAKLITMTYKL